MTKTNHGKHSSGAFSLLIGYVFQDRPLLYKALTLVIFATALDVVGPMISKVFIDNFIIPDSYPQWPVIGITLLYVLSIVLSTVLKYQQTLKFVDLALNAVLDIRKRAFHHVLSLPMAYFDYARTGQLVSRITNDTESIKDVYVQFLSNVVSNVIMLFGILIAMAILDIQLMLIALALMPAVALVIYIYQRLSGGVVAESRQLRSDINATISESIGGMAVIQSTNQQDPKLKQFNRINDRHYRTRLKTMTIASFLLRPAINLMSVIVTAAIVWFFGINVVQGVTEIGVLYAYLNYLGRFTQPLMEIAQQFSLYQQAIVAGSRVNTLLSEPTMVENLDAHAQLSNGQISLNQVYFGYNPDKPVLKDISIDIPAGHFFAVVGHTGSGKSTLLSLLLNFYQPQAGRIQVDGHLLQEFSHDMLRQGIGFIPQEPFILSSSIFDNISMGREFTAEQVEVAAKEAHLHDVIMAMSDGYQTHLGEGGSRLSTGQRQQLIIARALVGSPKVLLLDEATANVDSETEQVVQKALNNLYGRVTMIVVAHRLSTIRNADTILVLDDGELIEQGNHQALMRIEHGRYRAMYELQQQEQKVALAAG
ncbi:MAG: ABC transporter ATP-binding protein [Vibrio sp.]